MSKKNKHKPQGNSGSSSHDTASTAPKPPLISKRGWKIIGAGAGVVALGYVVLCFTDPQGQNWASHLSPFLLIAGYAAIGYGIIAKDPA